MNHSELPNRRDSQGDVCGLAARAELSCPQSARSSGIDALTSDSCHGLADAGCPLAADVHHRLQFETLLTELSAKFVNVPASQVDSQIEWGLRRIVELLGLDRSGLGQVSGDRKQLVVTHSYQLPGIPPSAKLMLDSQFPTYARMVHQGMVIRLPDDMPPEATQEREYLRQTGLKSNVTIPLIVMGTVVGGIGFSSFRSPRSLPDELIPRLRLVGDIFTNALARKRADEALSAKGLSLRRAKDGLRQLATKLLNSQEEERRRIAREMHDDWTQRLAILGLVEALRSECDGFSRREEIAVDYGPAKMPTNMPKGVALCVYRVAQEALRNVAKHAAVKEASVKLAATATELVLRVQDQGGGFDAENGLAQAGIGLSSMEERIHLVHGELSITSAPGQGTTVEVRVPLSGSEA